MFKSSKISIPELDGFGYSGLYNNRGEIDPSTISAIASNTPIASIGQTPAVNVTIADSQGQTSAPVETITPLIGIASTPVTPPIAAMPNIGPQSAVQNALSQTSVDPALMVTALAFVAILFFKGN